MRWLRDLDAHAEHRRLCCIEYASTLRGASQLKLLQVGAQPLYYYPILAGNKSELLRQAKARGLELIAWPVSTPIYPVERTQDLRAYGYEPGACPVAEDVAQRLLGLPARPGVSVEHRRRIVALLTGR
jgi:dTDP-4-amino-4,6-dideoxygalactose transaminase